MIEPNVELLQRLVTGHRILVRQRVLDTFGHISVRDPQADGVFWLSAALPPSRVEVGDFMAFGLDGEPLARPTAPLFSERFIHSEIFRARPDVAAVCHHHAGSILPFCISGARLSAVSQTGAFIGEAAPLWDSADEFGDTKLLVDNPEQAASLARALGEAAIVLMRGHGAVVAGSGIEDVVFKSVYSSLDADYQRAAAQWGPVKKLSPGEIAAIGSPKRPAIERGWAHWTAELGTSELGAAESGIALRKDAQP